MATNKRIGERGVLAIMVALSLIAMMYIVYLMIEQLGNQQIILNNQDNVLNNITEITDTNVKLTRENNEMASFLRKHFNETFLANIVEEDVQSDRMEDNQEVLKANQEILKSNQEILAQNEHIIVGLLNGSLN